MIRLRSSNSKLCIRSQRRAAARLGPFAATLYGLLLSFALASCTLSSETLEFEKAEKASRNGEHQQALEHYDNVVDRYVKTPLAIKSAKEAARISHYQLKRYKEAAEYYKHVVLYGGSSKERTEAQKQLADLHFNQTLDYNQAILEYNRLLELQHGPKEDLLYRLAIARSYFYLSNFFQSQVEIETILKKSSDQDLIFDALLLKANVFLTTKKLDDAILTLRQLMEKFPERSKTETIGLVLAICYEEKKDFTKAIETLESIKEIYPRRAFIEQRIKTLRERQSYLPGARGWKK